MLPRLFATAFARRLASRLIRADRGSLEQALVATGITLAATRPRRPIGLALIAAAGMLAWRRRARG